MGRFKQFLIENEKMETGDLKKTLNNVPAQYRELLKGYTFQVQGGNVLKNDEEHIGSNDMDKKKIVIAAPWHHSRSFALLHELGHLVYAKFVEPYPEKVKEWKSIVKKTKNKLHQNAEENFCHGFSNIYVKHKVVIHNHPEWEKFIRSLS